MHYNLLLLFLFSTLFSQSISYSKDEILAFAFSNSEKLKQIEAEVKKTESIRKEYNGKALPTIEGNAGYQYAFQQVPLALDMSSLSSVNFTNSLTGTPTANEQIIAGTLDGMLSKLSSTELLLPKNSLSFGLSLYQPIFAQGKVITGIKIAKIYEQTMAQKYRDAQFQLAEAITVQYDQTLIAQKNVAIQQEALTLAQKTHSTALMRFNTGKGSSLDTLNSRFDVQKALYTKRDADKKYRLALQQLFTTAAIDRDPLTATLSDTLVTTDFSLSYEQAEQLMLQNNSTIILLNLAQELQEKMTTLSKTSFFPSLVAGASIAKVSQFDGGDNLNWHNDGKLFASLNVPIFSGTQRFQKVKQARFDEDKIREKRSDVIRQLKLALRASFEEYAVAQAELKQTAELKELSKEGFRVSSLSFEVGQITQLDLSKSQQQYNQAQLAYYNALYTLEKATTKIKRLIGDTSLISMAASEDTYETN